MLRNNRLVTALVLVVLLLAVPSMQARGKRREAHGTAQAVRLLTIKADLAGASAIPNNGGPASGDVTGTYDPATHLLRYRAYFVDLTGPATNAKFYGSAAIDRVGWAVVAAPRPEARLVSGTAWLDEEEEQDLLAGRWYFNVTTQKYPQGEIRGAVYLTDSTSEL